MPKIKPKDIVAIVFVVGVIVLAIFRPFDALGTTLGTFLGYYFAHRKSGNDIGI